MTRIEWKPGVNDEEYVRSRWKVVYIGDLNGHWYTDCTCAIHLGGGASEAAAYTAEREQAIRMKREEIERLTNFWPKPSEGNPSYPAWHRTLAVREAQLAELLKGWRA